MLTLAAERAAHRHMRRARHAALNVQM